MSGKETLRSQILNAARELFAEEGYRNVSMRKIALKIGYSATTIYLYFKNKGEIVTCLAEEIMERIVAAFEGVQRENLDPVAQLKKMGDAYIRLATEDPHGYRIAFMMETDLWPRPEDYMPRGSQTLKAYQIILKTVEARVGSKEVKREEIEAAAQSMFVAVHGLVAMWLTYPTFPWACKERLKRLVIDSAVGGIS